MELVNSPEAPQAVGPYCHAVKVGNLLYTSGQIALSPDTGKIVEGAVKEQTLQVFENLKAVLKTANTDLSKVIKATVFIKDMDQFKAVNEVYAAEFGSHRPARSCVQVARLPLDALVEIELVVSLN